jgi:hypothetical protein
LNIALKVIVGLVALLFAFMGTGLVFGPETASAQYGLEATGAVGFSTLRGDFGGMFFAAAVMLVLGLWRGNTVWFLAVAVLMIAIALGRVVGFAVEGAVGQTITPLVAELVIAAVLYAAHVRLRAGQAGAFALG